MEALKIITAIGTIVTPVMVIVLSAIGWKIKSSFDRKISLENTLREDRVEVYNKILEPFIIFLMSKKAWAQDKRHKHKNQYDYAASKLLSLEYREYGFKLSLTGSDAVVKKYNDLMQYIYHSEENNRSESFAPDMLKLLGNFLLEIRRSMGNEDTKLDNWDMCEWWMSDAREIREAQTRKKTP